MELDRNQIIEAYRYCINGICSGDCPYVLNDDSTRCDKNKLGSDVLEIIKNLHTENKVLREELADRNIYDPEDILIHMRVKIIELQTQIEEEEKRNRDYLQQIEYQKNEICRLKNATLFERIFKIYKQ